MQRSDLDISNVEAVMTAALAHYNQHRGMGVPCTCVSCIVLSSVARRRSAAIAEQRRIENEERDRAIDEQRRQQRLAERRLPYRED